MYSLLTSYEEFLMFVSFIGLPLRSFQKFVIYKRGEVSWQDIAKADIERRECIFLYPFSPIPSLLKKFLMEKFIFCAVLVLLLCISWCSDNITVRNNKRCPKGYLCVHRIIILRFCQHDLLILVNLDVKVRVHTD